MSKVWFFLFLFVIPSSFSQSLLQNYVDEGIANNDVLKQKKISYQKATLALQDAKSLFLPKVEFQGDYTSGEGGRKIDLPVGDMLNPVYTTLNALTNSNSFPQIGNVKEGFFPFHFYDAKVRTSMPIFNLDLFYNKEIKEYEIQITDYQISIYKKDLIKEIKTAYYDYLSSISAIKIYEMAMELAAESKRVNESLEKNGAGIKVYILRAESEIEELNAKLAEAKENSINAKRYFNFLLNKNLDSEVKLDKEVVDNDFKSKPNYDGKEDFAENRDELLLLSKVVDIHTAAYKMNSNFRVPKVSGFLDLGAQDRAWNFNNDSKYYLWGIHIDLPIWDGFISDRKIESAQLNIEEAKLELELATNKINLAKRAAYSSFETSLSNYSSAKKQLQTALAYNNLITKGYKEGVNTYIETVDARTRYTQAELNKNIKKYRALSALATFEREIGKN